MNALISFLAACLLASTVSGWHLGVWLLASFAGFISISSGPVYGGPCLLASLIGGVWLAGWWAIPLAIFAFAAGTQAARERTAKG